MKQYLYLHYGFVKPTQEIMQAWGKWFEKIADRIVDDGGRLTGGKEVSKSGTRDLPMDLQAITGFTIIHAESFDEAVKLAQDNPFISSIRVYEVMRMKK